MCNFIKLWCAKTDEFKGKIIMKKLWALPIIAMLIIAGCEATPTPLDPVSIQNTAVAMAWTSVAQTQAVDIVATVNAQGTQIAILSQPTIAITPTQNPLYILSDKGITDAILAVLGGNESEISNSEIYNDGNLAIGSYFRTGANATGNDNGFWFVERDSNGQWVATYISQGLPLCEKIQNFKTQYPFSCLDANGNEVMLNLSP